MILEVAILNIKPNETKNFERDFKKASDYIREIKGYKTHTLKRCIEQNNKYFKCFICIILFFRLYLFNSC